MDAPLAPRLIRASAGTGKTTELTTRYLSLLLRGERLERILATTFTRKAAFEIKDRVLRRLLAAATDSKKCTQLATDTQLSELTQQDVIDVLRYVVTNMHRFEICTLDSFITRIVSSFAFELGLSTQWRIENEDALGDVHAEALSRVCGEIESVHLRTLLELLAHNKAKRGVEIILKNVLSKLGDLYLESDTAAWNWLAGRGEYYSDEYITQTLAALEELELPRTAKGTVPRDWENALLKLQAALETRSYREILRNSLLQKVVQGEAQFSRKAITAEVVECLTAIAEQAGQVALKNIGDRTRTLYLLLGFYMQQLKELKSRQGIFTFTDIKRLFESYSLDSMLNEIYFRIDCQISHVLLDEFQDTSSHEWRVIKPIVAEVLAKASSDHSFFCVGDVKQAIYGWRGGVAEIFDALEDSWPQLQSTPFDSTYRCSQTVLNFVNSVFSYVPDSNQLYQYPRLQKIWRTRFSEHTAAVERDGFVSLHSILKADLPEALHSFAPEIETIITNAPDLSIGILVRRNKEVAETARVLKALLPGISISQEGGVSFASYPIITLIISLFELLDHPGDTLCWYHIRNSELASGLGVSLTDNSEQRAKALRLLRRQLLTDGYAAFLTRVCDCLLYRATPEQAQQLIRFCSVARGFVPMQVGRPVEFARWIAQKKDEDSRRAQVRVMTVHQSKGLEFDAVFLPVLSSKLVGRDESNVDVFRKHPLAPPERICLRVEQVIRDRIPELQEAEFYERSRRVTESLSVLYVAVTRAKYALYLALPESSGKSEDSYAGLISDAVARTGCPARTGNPDWYCTVPKATQEIAPSCTVPRRLALTAQFNSLRTEYKTASELALKTRSVASLLSIHTRGRIALGLQTHSLLEQIDWIHADLQSELSNSGQWDESFLNDTFKLLLQPAIKPLFLSATYAQTGITDIFVYREKTFAFLEKNNLFSGAIDRLVVCCDSTGAVVTCDIIDYKTDAVADEEACIARAAVYEPQMGVYKRAVELMYGVEPSKITAKLLFLQCGSVLSV